VLSFRPKSCASVLELQTMESESLWHIHARVTDIFLRHLPRHRPNFWSLDIILYKQIITLINHGFHSLSLHRVRECTVAVRSARNSLPEVIIYSRQHRTTAIDWRCERFTFAAGDARLSIGSVSERRPLLYIKVSSLNSISAVS
jgi:hypothetical protein